MIIGAMNHPRKDVIEEIKWMADMGLGFLDLTLEPPASASWRVDPERIRRELERHGLDVVGHTAYYLPIDSPFEEVRQGAVTELKRCLRAFSVVGAKWMNIHPGRYTPMHPRSFYISRNLESLRELQEVGDEVGVGLMVENIPTDFNNPDQLGDLLDQMPELMLHLDIGHSNLDVPENTTPAILERFGERLRHVHLHDNKGGHADLHLPLGAGTMDVETQVKALKGCGYDGTITLEVFTPDQRYFRASMDVLNDLWSRINVADVQGVAHC